ncbi:MAG: hypothetical protein M1118_06845, partial [Chloroflexi bacterium]|nr:hypothetical protein [Chloroflexota bacterium]
VFLRQGKLFWAAFGDRSVQEVAPEDMPEESDPDRNWVEAIAYGHEIGAPAICGLRTIELTEAAWRSAASGKPAPIIRQDPV